jgi:hypothetical protein
VTVDSTCRNQDAMMARRMIICEIVGIIFTSFSLDHELSVLDSISNPIETHVNRFGASLFDRVVRCAGCTQVVRLNWCRRLGMTKVFKNVAQHRAIFCIVKTAPSSASHADAMTDLRMELFML